MLSEEERWKIIHLLHSGLSVTQTATRLGCTRKTVRHWRDQHQSCKNVKDLPRSGRPKLPSPVVNRAIRGKMRGKRARSIRRLARTTKASSTTTLSPSTVYRRVRAAGGKSRVRPKKPNLNARQIRARVLWCRERRNQGRWWRRVLWTDEHSIPLFADERHEWVFDGDEPTHRRTSKFTPSFRVWAGFSYYGRTPLIRIPKKMNADIYITMLEEKMLPAATDMFDGKFKRWWFQHDGDGTHTAKKTCNWLDSDVPQWIKDWPANSPDLNLIENGWARLRQELIGVECGTLEEKWEAAKKAWANIPQAYFQRLVDSMDRRIDAVLAVNGHPTKY